MENEGSDYSGMIDLSGKIMVVSVIFLFFVLIFVFCLHLYARWFWSHHQAITTTTAARRRRRRLLDFAAGHYEVSATERRGLDPSVLKTIPVVTFDPKIFSDELECAVCLCEVCEGEMARLLPKCNHWFHVDCIDMWFRSHSTCPLCRSLVVSSNPKPENNRNPVAESALVMMEQDHQLQGGDDVEEPSSSSSMAIDIPRQINEEEDGEEQISALSARFKSLKRLLSGGNSTRVNPSSPRNLDQEQV